MAISPARTVAFDILLRVDRESSYASELLHSQGLEALSQADRGLATEIVMGVLRWRSLLDDAIAGTSARAIGRLDVEVLTALRVGAYQLRYLDRIPAHAGINDSVELVKRARKQSASAFVNAVLRKLSSSRPTHPKRADEWVTRGPIRSEILKFDSGELAREFAHPLWLVERWVSTFGMDRARRICGHDQQVPATAIRIDDPAVEEELRSEGIQLVPGALMNSARVVADGEVTRTRAFHEGRLFIQDEASQLVAALVGTGSRLLDCCAAPGGKTAALAARNPTAQILAAELHSHRAELLRKRVRAGNVQVIQADALHLSPGEGFDRVLADVPCSGTGTLARNPEIKWRLTAEDLADLHQRQVGILRAALRQLTPGGRAVYSTCSLEREEGEAVVEEVLQGAPEYKLRDMRDELEQLRASGELAWAEVDSLISGKFLRTVPGLHPSDGFFAAEIEKQ